MGQACDCAPADGEVWTLPGEALSLFAVAQRRTDRHDVVRLDCAHRSRSAGSWLYDTVLSPAAADFELSAVCVESNGSDTQTTHTTPPDPGQVLFFLVRAENGCGMGGAGGDSAGSPRVVLDCS